jgi:hypothetical protein
MFPRGFVLCPGPKGLVSLSFVGEGVAGRRPMVDHHVVVYLDAKCRSVDGIT